MALVKWENVSQQVISQMLAHQAQNFVGLFAGDNETLPTQTAQQLIANQTHTTAQQLFGGMVGLVKQMEVRAEAAESILHDLKARRITIEQVNITDEGARVMPARPSKATPADTVVEELKEQTVGNQQVSDESKAVVADISRKQAAKAGV